jgi:amino acid adenylation domain-containing protein
MRVDGTLHSRFLDVASAYADRTAIICAGRALTYGELAERSGCLADTLRRAATPTDQVAAMCLERGEQVPIAILGILRAGLAYVPVDPAYPTSRREHMLAGSGAVLRVGDGLQVSRADVAPRRVTEGTAYVIHTSGSSGKPKGCMVGHEHVLALLDACDQVFDFTVDDVWSVLHSHSFDFSVWELWGALLHGGCAVILRQEEVTDPATVSDLLARHRVTVLNQTPSAFAFLMRECVRSRIVLPDLRYVVFGGETIRTRDIARWCDAGVASTALMANMYGITETTVHVTHRWLGRTPHQGNGTPIGRPLPHLDVSLRDERGRPVERGQPGEIWVSGDAVSYGYLDRPEETRTRFLVDSRTGRRSYRSGDWAVAGPDGELYYLGRKDNQIKLGGFRIELEEVEAVFRDAPGVQSVACGLSTNDLGQPVLVAYVVAEPAAERDTTRLRRYAAATLPAHLRPHRVHWLPELPLNGNGKLDRAALAGRQVTADGVPV